MACVQAGVPAGIATLDSSVGVIRRAKVYLAAGGRVFNDSGAFGAFQRGMPLDAAAYRRHLDVSLDLAMSAHPGRLHVVAPDVVGDQAATLELLRQYAPQLREIAACGAVIIVPLQVGETPLRDCFSIACALLAPVMPCAGLPSRAVALGTDAALEFIRSTAPSMIHFLGAARSRRFQNMLSDARHVSPTTLFTYDAVVSRGICDDLSPTQNQLHGQALTMLENRDVDDTEISPLIDRSPASIKACAVAIGWPVEAVSQALDSECEILASQLAESWGIYSVRYAECVAADQWRTQALAAHPSFALDPHLKNEGQSQLVF